VVFENTTTALPTQITAETSKRIDSISFTQEKSQLVANIDVSFSYFDIKSFSISKPDRVVLDVTPLNKPPDGVVFEDRLERAPVPEPLEATPATPAVEPGAEVIKTRSTPVQTTSDEAPKAVEQPKATEPTQPLPPSQAVSSQEVAKAVPVAVKEPPRPKKTEKDMPRATQVAPSTPAETGLQTILLVVLLVLSTVIVGLLALIVFRKRQVVGKRDDLLEMTDEREDSLAAIDDKLRRELRKID
jgi:hypothetical protein